MSNEYTAQSAFYDLAKLRARVERLEHAQQQQPAPSTPAGLVSGVAALIADFASTSRAGDDCTPAARRLILAVAAWLSSQHYFYTAADALRRELGR
jgi:hypothetical protein